MKEETRHTILFNDEITFESVQELINSMSNYNAIDLFFATNGGSPCAIEALLNYLNWRKDKIVIHLTDRICSSGVDILTCFEGKIILSKNLDYIIFHIVDRSLYTLRTPFEHKELINQLKEENERELKVLKALGLNEKELKTYKSGKDVILYRRDFSRLNINRL